MPVIIPGGDLAIVAHQDDDILFMNPDIADSIDAGLPVTTVFLTAGDAGLGVAYWEGREAGAKAAYALMAGTADWVDDVQTFQSGGTSFQINTSYLDSAPDVRLYFLRLPDGAGNISEEASQSLARLQTGTLDQVATVDGSAVYERADVVNVLVGIMDLHEPSQFRLQIDQGDFASGEHTDHLQTSIFANEALESYGGGDYTVTSYVQYQSRNLDPNLSPEDAARTLAIMEAYAEFDLAVLAEGGALQPVYVDWTMRQYVADEYQVGVAPASISGSYFADIDDDGLDDDGAGVEDATVTLFRGGSEIASTTTNGAGDYSFTGLTAGSGYRVGFEAPDAVLGNADLRFVTTGDSDVASNGLTATFALAEGNQITGINAGAAGFTTPPEPPEPPTGPVAGSYSLAGPDAFLFDVNPSTGAVTPKDWFIPSLGDAWDQNEDYVYDVTRITIPDDGSAQISETLLFDTVAEGVLSQITPDGTPVPEEPVTPEPPEVPDTPDEPEEPDTPTPPSGGDFSYSLIGPDALLFVVDEDSGVITSKDWFNPTYDDAWDIDENHIYEITRIADPADGAQSYREDVRYQMTPDEEFLLISGQNIVASTSLIAELSVPPEEPEARESNYDTDLGLSDDHAALDYTRDDFIF